MQVFGYSRILTQSKYIVLWLSFVSVESTSRKHLRMSADGSRVNELFANASTRNPGVHQPWQKFTRIRVFTRPWKEDRSFWNRLKWSSCWAGECLSVIRRGRRLHHVMQGSFCDAFCENDLGRGPLLDQLVTHIHRIPSTSSSARPSALHATRGGFPTARAARPAGDSRSEDVLDVGVKEGWQRKSKGLANVTNSKMRHLIRTRSKFRWETFVTFSWYPTIYFGSRSE